MLVQNSQADMFEINSSFWEGNSISQIVVIRNTSFVISIEGNTLSQFFLSEFEFI